MKFTVKDAMTSNVVTVKSDATIDDVCALLLRHRISGMPVVDQDNRLVGIVSELDLLRLLFDTETTSNCVSQYLTGDVVSVTEEDPLTKVADIFMSQGLRRLPVVRDGQLIGIVSRRDVVRFIRDLRMRFTAEMRLRREAPAASTSVS